jgi:hypothetical protein
VFSPTIKFKVDEKRVQCLAIKQQVNWCAAYLIETESTTTTPQNKANPFDDLETSEAFC